MPGQIPDIVTVYRIIHIENVEYVLTNGMFTRNHPKADPDYINIGDNKLIAQRDTYPVGINPPNGTLGEYIPFYFGPLSPMLLNIITGYRGITYRPQNDIIYICCTVHDVVSKCAEWCFTDGHAKNVFTEFYNNLVYLTEVDWDMVSAKEWNAIETDMDRMRRKQAEFLVKDHVPVDCITNIVVFNQKSKTVVEEVINHIGLDIPVLVNPNNKFYY